MSQRKDPPKKDGLTLPDHPSFWRPLQRTKTIKHDLDEHLKMLQVIDTKDKAELKKLVKGSK